MSCVVIVGAQWGDEGKGKIVDIYTEFADVVVRYAGGPNAGHTLVVGDEKLVVRLLPSGILRPQTRCVLGQGMVLTAIGLAIGLAGATILMRTLSGLIYGVGTLDPLTFVTVPALLCAVALIACFLPARRAASVDPITTLRQG